MRSESDKVAIKAVRWNGIPSKTTIYAVRDQPTWKNCKLQRPPEVKNDLRHIPSGTDRETPSQLTHMSAPGQRHRRSLTPKSGPSDRTANSARSTRVSTSSSDSTISNSLTLQDAVLAETYNNGNARSGKGREIIKRKVKELTQCHSNGYEDSKLPSSPVKRGESRSIKRFRIASAESGHRSPDVSIGLRQILTVSRSFVKPKLSDPNQRRRSETLLTTLVKVTSKNISATRRQGYPPASSHVEQNYDNFPRIPAPGEGYLQRRRSSVSAPATMGTNSNSYFESRPTKRIAKAQKKRTFPETTIYSPFADREWRPPNLQKYSLLSPWAPAQQTGRYFPNYSNMQDVHCRNPYLVPGSILYKEHVALK